MALSTTSSRRRRVTLPSVCMLLQQYSLDHKSGHAHRGRGTCTAWLFADGSATRRKPALSFHPPCVSMVKMWLEPLRHATFLPLWHTTFLPVQPGGVPITVSPLLTPPLLRLGSVGVLTSVPVALVIKRAGYTHTRVFRGHSYGLLRYVGCHALGPALVRSSIMVLAPPPRELPTHTQKCLT